jgi:hypothetical protein
MRRGGKGGGGKQFEAIGNRKIIARKSGTYVNFPYNLDENQKIEWIIVVTGELENQRVKKIVRSGNR